LKKEVKMQKINKGQRMPLEKDLSAKSCRIGFRWDSSSASGYALDVSIMMLSERGKLEKEEDFIFYNNLSSGDGSINMDSSPFGNYKNTSRVMLDKVTNQVSRLLLVITIDNAVALGQSFAKIRDLTLDILDDQKNIIYSYAIDGLSKETAVIAGEIYKKNNEWRFMATGNGFNSGLAALLREYGSEAVQIQEDNVPPPVPPVIRQNQPINNFQQTSAPKNPVGSREFITNYNRRNQLVKRLLTSSGINSGRLSFSLCLDLSVSMSMALKSGYVQEIFELLLPLAMEFENNGNIPVFLFNDQAFLHQNPLSFANTDSFVNHEILFNYHLSGTKYAPAIDLISQKLNPGEKNYVLFLTDGDCEDFSAAEISLKRVSNSQIFWKFVGLEGNSGKYSFLNKINGIAPQVSDFYLLNSIRYIDENAFYQGLINKLANFWKK